MTIYLLHGFCMNHSIWDPMLDLMTETNIVKLSLPGYNNTNSEIFSDIEQLALHLAKDIKNPGILVGHSMGGYVALQICKLFPKKIKGLILFHSHVFADSIDTFSARQKHIDFINRNDTKSFYKQLIPNLFYEKKNNTINSLVESADSVNKQILINNLELMMSRPDMSTFIDGLSVPVGFIIGIHDTILSESDWIRQTLFPKVSCVYFLRNSAHMGMLEEPNKSSDAILDFKNYC